MKTTKLETPMTLSAIVISEFNKNGIELIFDDETKCIAHLHYNKKNFKITYDNNRITNHSQTFNKI